MSIKSEEFLLDNYTSSSSEEYSSYDSDSDTESDSYLDIGECTHVLKMHHTDSQRILAQEIVSYEESVSSFQEMSSKYSVNSPRSTRIDAESNLNDERRSLYRLSLQRLHNRTAPFSSVHIPTVSPVERMSVSPNTYQDDQLGQRSLSEENFCLKSSISFQPLRICLQRGKNRILEATRVRKIITNSQNRYINKYLLEERIGKGSFGTVRRCKDITTGISYAMKIMKKKNLQHQLKYTRTENNTIERSSALDHVEQEIAIMKKIQHRNIVNLVEVINSEKVLYLILEYMPYGSLAKGTARITRLASEFNGDDCELLRLYMRDMVSGLAYLHSQRICHGDIKPENILIGDDGTLKLGDFGLSHFLSQGQSSRVFNEKDGTPAFQAPECLIEAEDHKFSLYPTDIWALGVTLYQVKYGYLPFFANEEEKLMEKIKKEPVNLPSSESDQDFINLVHALLDKDPLKRIKVEQLCVHPWITDRGRLEEIPYDFIPTNVTESEEKKAMSRLIKMSPRKPNDNSIPNKDRCQSANKLISIKDKWQLAGRSLSGLYPSFFSIAEQSEDNIELSSIQASNELPYSLNDISLPCNANSLEYLENQDVSFSNSPRILKLGLQIPASLNMKRASSEINSAYLEKMTSFNWAWMRNERGSKNESTGINGKRREFVQSGESESAAPYIELIKPPEVDPANPVLSPMNVVSSVDDNDVPVHVRLIED